MKPESCANCPLFAMPGPVYGSGDTSSRILLLGEAPGAEEIAASKPFVGGAGRILNAMLAQSGIYRDDVFVDNVVRCRPPDNKIDPYIPKAYECCMALTRKMLQRVFPNITVLLGNTPLKAIAGVDSISNYRGSLLHKPEFGKLLPTIHPAYIMRSYSMYSVVVSDLKRAKVESETNRYTPHVERFNLSPTLADVSEFVGLALKGATPVAIDVEVESSVITMLALATSEADSINVPFAVVDAERNAVPYWTDSDGYAVWGVLDALFRSANIKIFHNAAFDIYWLEQFGWRVVEPIHDTMLMHHTLYSELPHKLKFLASIYTNIPYWKSMAREVGEEVDK